MSVIQNVPDSFSNFCYICDDGYLWIYLFSLLGVCWIIFFFFLIFYNMAMTTVWEIKSFGLRRRWFWTNFLYSSLMLGFVLPSGFGFGTKLSRMVCETGIK